jgi:heme/copper-type cytochrome/quinol oxidase subunit 2
MYFMWCLIGLFILYVSFIYYRRNSLDGIVFGVPLVVTFCSFILNAIMMDCTPVNIDIIPDEIPIVAVRSSDGIKGSFVFGTGSFSTTERYVCYKKVNGCIKQVLLPVESTWIIEDADSSNARIENTSLKYKWFHLGPNYPTYTETYLHVPPGTVVQELKIN